MPLFGILIALIVICLLFWAVRALLSAFAIGDPIATVIYVVMVVFVILWLVSSLGGYNIGALGSMHVGGCH